jgi:hypothetical protein
MVSLSNHAGYGLTAAFDKLRLLRPLRKSAICDRAKYSKWQVANGLWQIVDDFAICYPL